MTHRYDSDRDARIVQAYTRSHLTLRAIGKLEGLSPAGVQKALRRAGIEREDGTWVHTTCAHCHAKVKQARAQWRTRKAAYCNLACYRAKRANPSYVQSSPGQRQARKAVMAAGFPLLKGHVVHHWDGNSRHNSLANLAVFESQRDHMRFHHGTGAEPIWDGRRL